MTLTLLEQGGEKFKGRELQYICPEFQVQYRVIPCRGWKLGIDDLLPACTQFPSQFMSLPGCLCVHVIPGLQPTRCQLQVMSKDHVLTLHSALRCAVLPCLFLQASDAALPMMYMPDCLEVRHLCAEHTACRVWAGHRRWHCLW